MGRNQDLYWWRHGVPRWRQKKERKGNGLRKGQCVVKRKRFCDDW